MPKDKVIFSRPDVFVTEAPAGPRRLIVYIETVKGTVWMSDTEATVLGEGLLAASDLCRQENNK